MSINGPEFSLGKYIGENSGEIPPELSTIIFGIFERADGSKTLVTAKSVFDRTTFAELFILGALEPFSSNSALRAFVKTVPELRPWIYSIPEGNSPKDRIMQLVAHLKFSKNIAGKNALVMFLLALSAADVTESMKDDILVTCESCSTVHRWATQSCNKCGAPIIYQKKNYIFKPLV